jgi:hypothetical protein
MTSEIYSEFITDEVLSELGGYIRKYFDRYFAEDSLSDMGVLVLSLYLIDRKRGKVGAQYIELKQLFTALGRKEHNFYKVFRNAVDWGIVATDKRDQELIVSLTYDGIKLLDGILGRSLKAKVFVIKSGQGFTAIKMFEEFLTSTMNCEEILLCDPYVSPQTLYPFTVLKGKLSSLKILTTNVSEGEKFKDYIRRFKQEYNVKVEVRTTRKIHDRYLICGDKCWSIGCSIKDLGNKDTIIKELDEVARSLKDLFEDRWNDRETAVVC